MKIISQITSQLNFFNTQINTFFKRTVNLSIPFFSISDRMLRTGNNKTFRIIFVLIFTMILSLRGIKGIPLESELNTPAWKENGPFELSPERGRFTLMYSLIENHSFHYSIPLARFVTPDLGYWKEKYVSLVAPGLSFLVMPGYVVGKFLGISQVGAFAAVAAFAIANCILIKRICESLGANKTAAWLAGLVFLFATPAYTYGVTLYQHHISTSLILLSLYILMKAKKTWPLFFVFFLCAASIPIDNPNLFLMFPIGLWTFSRIVQTQTTFGKLRIKIPLAKFYIFSGIILPLLFFIWFNYKSYGNPFQLSGTIAYVAAIDENGEPTTGQTSDMTKEELANALSNYEAQSSIGFFNSRNILNGLYIHLISPDRGVIVFTPVILLGVVGAFMLYKKRNRYFPLLLSIVLINLTLYSLWGDPWGGWAFGSRYLIPAYALLAIFLSIALTKLRKKHWFIALFWLLMVYSIGVNTLGALTSNANPPKVQVLSLEALSGHRERYTYIRNWDQLVSGTSKSFVFQTWAHHLVSAEQYYILIAGSIILMATGLTVKMVQHRKKA